MKLSLLSPQKSANEVLNRRRPAPMTPPVPDSPIPSRRISHSQHWTPQPNQIFGKMSPVSGKPRFYRRRSASDVVDTVRARARALREQEKVRNWGHEVTILESKNRKAQSGQEDVGICCFVMLGWVMALLTVFAVIGVTIFMNPKTVASMEGALTRQFDSISSYFGMASVSQDDYKIKNIPCVPPPENGPPTQMPIWKKRMADDLEKRKSKPTPKPVNKTVKPVPRKIPTQEPSREPFAARRAKEVVVTPEPKKEERKTPVPIWRKEKVAPPTPAVAAHQAGESVIPPRAIPNKKTKQAPEPTNLPWQPSWLKQKEQQKNARLEKVRIDPKLRVEFPTRKPLVEAKKVPTPKPVKTEGKPTPKIQSDQKPPQGGSVTTLAIGGLVAFIAVKAFSGQGGESFSLPNSPRTIYRRKKEMTPDNAS